MRLEGISTLTTGASQGLGRAPARGFGKTVTMGSHSDPMRHGIRVRRLTHETGLSSIGDRHMPLLKSTGTAVMSSKIPA